MQSKVTVSRVEDFECLRSDSNNKGAVFAVTREVFEHYAKRLQQQVKEIELPERQALENLLCIDTSGATAGLTRNCACSHCGHALSFVDHVASAILSGAHSAEDMRRILTGPQYWLTVDTDELRVVRCPRCYMDFAAVHCCYTYSNYAYA